MNRSCHAWTSHVTYEWVTAREHTKLFIHIDVLLCPGVPSMSRVKESGCMGCCDTDCASLYVCGYLSGFAWRLPIFTSRIGSQCLAQNSALCVWHDSLRCVLWLNHECDVTHSHVRRDSIMCVIHMCAMTQSDVWHDALICATWCIHTCDMTYTCVWRDSIIYVTWRIHKSHMDSYECHSCACHIDTNHCYESLIWIIAMNHVSFMICHSYNTGEAWLIHMSPYVRRDSFI